jgi:hypothetical protein
VPPEPVLPPEVPEEPPDAGDEPPDAGDEPPDAGDEPPDAGDEPPDEGDEPPDEEADGDDDPPLELAAVVGVVEVVDVAVEDGVAELAAAPVGTVNGGAPELSTGVEPPPPQAESPADRAMAAMRVASRRERPSIGESQEPSGSIRLPQFGQSFRSFCVSWSHQLQKRRFSTAQGSSEGVDASGSSTAITSNGSPVSRST